MSVDVLITRLKENGIKALEYEKYIENYHKFVISKIQELTGKDVYLIESDSGQKYFEIEGKRYKYMETVLYIENWKRKGEDLERKTQQLLQQHQVSVFFVPEEGILEIKKKEEVLFCINLKTKEVEKMIFNSQTIAISPMFPRMLLLIQNF